MKNVALGVKHFGRLYIFFVVMCINGFYSEALIDILQDVHPGLKGTQVRMGL